MAGIPVQGQGLLKVAGPNELAQRDAEQANAVTQQRQQQKNQDFSGLSGYIRGQFELFKLHRNTPNAGWSERLLAALRAFNGVYDPEKLKAIKAFGGSEVYAKLIAKKCRGASSLLRDVYLSADKPWGLIPPDDPPIPPEVTQAISQLIQYEMMVMQQHGQPFNPEDMQQRATGLLSQARDAAKKQARDKVQIAEDKVNEFLIEGGFYQALAEFLIDLPLFPFAVLKGPVVRVQPTVTWQSNRPTVEMKPRITYCRISPFDIWWTPGASSFDQCNFIERTRVARHELNDCLDLPGYNVDEVRAVLTEYGQGGINDQWDMTDAERAVQESRENPWLNRSGMINCLEFNGNVQGSMLIDQGINVPDPIRDYKVQAWLIGNHVIKTQISPSPRQRSPYYITSFEKVPGTPIGNGLPDILSDIQDVTNATLRALVNNVSIASGPQVVVNLDRIVPGEDANSLYPWKRWMVNSDPLGNNTQEPISFFQPTDNSATLINDLNYFAGLADDLSGIPRYLSGEGAGGAGRTSSGLSMLMQNANKIIQTVAANIDRDVIQPCIENLLDMILLTDQSGLLTGEEAVKVMGVQVSVQKETQRSRQLEFLQITANPLDQGIMGPQGRAKVLRSVSKTIGLDGEEIVPTDQEMAQKLAQQEAAAAAQPAQNIQAMVEKGIEAGVKAGVQRISTELTAGILAEAEHIGEGPPAHVGTPPAQGDMATAAAQAQGSQQGSPSTGDAGPRNNLHQQQPKPTISGGVH
jgi:hypothetical protein